MAFKRALIIKKRADFVRVQSCRGVSGKYVVICSRESTRSHLRVGFTVTKKIGNAVVRNRCKRRLREVAYLLLKDHIAEACDYVFIAKKSITDISWNTLLSDVSEALFQRNIG